MVGDINGDGRGDHIGFGGANIYCRYWNGSSWGGNSDYANGPNYGPSFSEDDGWPNQELSPRFVADINGDGIKDIVGFKDAFVVLINSASGFGTHVAFQSDCFWASCGYTGQNGFPRMFGDINGDGKDDIIGFTDAGAEVALSDGTKMKSKFLFLSDFGRNQGLTDNSITPRYVADINGDGYADLIAFKEDGVYVSFTKFVCSHVSRDPNNKCNCYPGYEDLGDGKECYKQNKCDRFNYFTNEMYLLAG